MEVKAAFPALTLIQRQVYLVNGLPVLNKQALTSMLRLFAESIALEIRVDV
jgi:hypothetical protein